MTARRRPVTFNQAPDGSVTLQPSDLPTWREYITNFDAALQRTRDVLASLEDMGAPADPAAAAEYNQLIGDGHANLDKLQNLQQMRDSVSSWASGAYAAASGAYQGAVDFTSRDIIEPVADWLGRMTAGGTPPIVETPPAGATVGGLGQLGIVPLIIAGIGLAAFGAAVYAAVQWADRAQAFQQLNTIAQAAISKGQDPQSAYAQAAKTVNYAAGPGVSGLFAQFGQNLIWTGALVLLAIWGLPKLLAYFSRRGE